MRDFERAFLDVLLARAVWRALLDIEAQVAHWRCVGIATEDNLRDARAQTKLAHDRHLAAQRRYTRITSSASSSASLSPSSSASPRAASRPQQIGA